MLVRDSAPPNRHGKDPEERSVDELLRCGIIMLDKPYGPTSHQVTAWVRDIVGAKRIGHGGTLDPHVTGVLPILLGGAVRASDLILGSDKEYVCVMRLHKDRPEPRVLDVIRAFVGRIYQFPPARSAVKRQLRVRRVHSIDILQVEGRDVMFRVACDAGTYIRTLCVDIGYALGCGAHMEALRRTRSGISDEGDTFTLHQVKDAWEFHLEGDDALLRKMLRPVEDVFIPMRKVIVKSTAVDAVCHGADLMVPGVISVSDDLRRNSLVALMTDAGEALAIGRAMMDAATMVSAKEGVAVNVDRVFMAPGTYPKGWRANVSDE